MAGRIQLWSKPETTADAWMGGEMGLTLSHLSSKNMSELGFHPGRDGNGTILPPTARCHKRSQKDIIIGNYFSLVPTIAAGHDCSAKANLPLPAAAFMP